MKHYYADPKTQNLIIRDTETGEVIILERIPSVRAFVKGDVRTDDDGESESEEEGNDGPGHPAPKRRGSAEGSEERRAAIQKLHSEGLSVAEIAKRVGCSTATVYNHIG